MESATIHCSITSLLGEKRRGGEEGGGAEGMNEKSRFYLLIQSGSNSLMPDTYIRIITAHRARILVNDSLVPHFIGSKYTFSNFDVRAFSISELDISKQLLLLPFLFFLLHKNIIELKILTSPL